MRPGGHRKTLTKPHPQQRQFIYRDILLRDLDHQSRDRTYWRHTQESPPPPSCPQIWPTAFYYKQLVFCKDKIFVVYWCWRETWDEVGECMLNAIKMVVNMAIPWWCLNLPLICLSTVNVLIEALSKRSKLLIRGRENVYHVVRIRGQLQLIASLWISVPYKLRSKYRPLPLATNISSLTRSPQVYT